MKSSATWFMMLNPEAGSGKGRRIQAEIEAALFQASISFELYLTKGPGDAIEATQMAITRGYRKIIAVGGDGTFNEIANGILKQTSVPSHEITLAIIPAGTGNDWSRTWKIPSDIQKAVQLIRTGTTQIQSAGLISHWMNNRETQTWFVNVAGCGFDAEVAHKANLAKAAGNSGFHIYIGALLKTLLGYQPVLSRIHLGGKQQDVSVFTLLAGIGQFAGNGMRLVPGASPLAAFFSVTLVKKISRMKIILNFLRLFSGSFIRFKEVEQFNCTEIGIHPSKPLFIQADGEVIGQTPAIFRIVPSKIRLVSLSQPVRN